MFSTKGTRPDIYLAIYMTSRFLNCFDNTYWASLRQSLAYCNATKVKGILYSHGDNTVTGYSDADYGS